MKLGDFLSELRLNGKALSIIPAEDASGAIAARSSACTLSVLSDAFAGKTVCFHAGMTGCPGAKRGMGLFDGTPQIKGGFGNFIANGSGDGFPEGERIKQSAEIAQKMLDAQPVDVLGGKPYILVKPVDMSEIAACVTFLCDPDQLSALVHLFTYRRSEYDSVIAPMCSGCASVFRIPLDERKRENPRGVIGNIDVFSRMVYDERAFFFTIPFWSFQQMLEDADSSFLTADKWKQLKRRIHGADG